MSTLNVKIPEEMEADIESFLDDHPHYLNKSEFVRDALRHAIETPRLSDRTLEDDRISREQIGDGDVVALENV
jgi:Arc/MetJ-type ribon-helix-helix transcriptional regulator